MGRVAELVTSEAIYKNGIDEHADVCFAALCRVQARLATQVGPTSTNASAGG